MKQKMQKLEGIGSDIEQILVQCWLDADAGLWPKENAGQFKARIEYALNAFKKVDLNGERMMKKCTWELISNDTEYGTLCGYEIDSPSEDYPLITAGWRYCPFCGKEIEEC